MGCFEITSKFYGAQYPITVLFRRPKMCWLHALTESGRTNQKINLATANMQGMRLLNREGFNIHLTALEDGAIATPTLLNKAIEHRIKQNPSQYLWAYPRYKVIARLLKKRGNRTLAFIKQTFLLLIFVEI